MEKDFSFTNGGPASSEQAAAGGTKFRAAISPSHGGKADMAWAGPSLSKDGALTSEVELGRKKYETVDVPEGQWLTFRSVGRSTKMTVRYGPG